MILQLKNEHLEVVISTTGAELKSIRKSGDTDGVEYLWQLNPEIWERQAPLLFPVIGRLKDEEYVHDGRKYKMDIHGFARFKEFSVVEKSNERVALEITHDEKTLLEYPFEFRLTISYTLSESSIIKEHRIENTGNCRMYYEIGGHEGYNLAFFKGEIMEDYFIEFNGMDSLMTYTTDENVMIEKDMKKLELAGNRLYLSPEVFKGDALIMDTFINRTVSLCNTKNNRKVVVEFNDFKYLGLWTKYMRGNYICIEPWTSLPDCNYLGKELNEKKDVRFLDAGVNEKLKYTISII
ncbi:MAG: aldose 1-epimerase family protein [Clostridia bacterium]|nr:aldose 1-epimerase family protein [Clostridia bacterium]MBN2883617.1 aldose 1-epimerase family protein [Clostridia bacterium]